MALQDEAGNREPPKVLAGGLQLDLQRGRDLPDRHLGLFAKQFEDFDSPVVCKPFDHPLQLSRPCMAPPDNTSFRLHPSTTPFPGFPIKNIPTFLRMLGYLSLDCFVRLPPGHLYLFTAPYRRDSLPGILRMTDQSQPGSPPRHMDSISESWSSNKGRMREAAILSSVPCDDFPKKNFYFAFCFGFDAGPPRRGL
jgi:hypothetical protein